MKKRKLNLEEIKVESFSTQSERKKSKGTIFGNDYPTALDCISKQPGCESHTDDEATCLDSCFVDCSAECLSNFNECNMTIAYPNCYTEGSLCP